MIILGIDPGSVKCGFGIIEISNNKPKYIECGIIDLKEHKEDFNLRLKKIYDSVSSIIQEFLPEVCVIESTFYSKNAQSLMKLSHARSAAIISAMNKGLKIEEFSPNEIKRSVTGRGHASKEQVLFMIKNQLGMIENPKYHDASDALAIALCYHYNRHSSKKSVSSWEKYIKINPEKIKKTNQ